MRPAPMQLYCYPIKASLPHISTATASTQPGGTRTFRRGSSRRRVPRVSACCETNTTVSCIRNLVVVSMSIKIPFAGKAIGFPLTAVRHGQWKCPECGSPVIVKRGKVKQAHFAHKAASSCTGESLLHKATKEWISAHACDPEFSITSRCHCCSTPMTVFRGSAALSGVVETTVHYSKVGCVNSSNEYHTCTTCH